MKPTPEQIRSALAAAEAMRERGEDPDALALTLLYLKRHCERLEPVFLHAERYVGFGQDEGEHRQLVRAIETARRGEAKEAGADAQDFGLTSSA